VDSPEGNRGGIYLDAGFSGLNVGDGRGCDFPGGCGFFVWFFVVNLWWIDGGLMVDCGEFVVPCVVVKNAPTFGFIFGCGRMRHPG
jgi:hypothetical protein